MSSRRRRRLRCSSAPSAPTTRCGERWLLWLPIASRSHEILELPEVRLHAVPGFETEVFAYFSDVPFLTNWGTPLLLGPGTIHVAHTDREQIAIADLERAVDLYADLAARLLRSSAVRFGVGRASAPPGRRL